MIIFENKDLLYVLKAISPYLYKSQAVVFGNGYCIYMIAIFDLEFRCDVTNYNNFLFRVIQPTQPNQTVSDLRATGPVTVWSGLVGWKCLFK